MPTYEYRCASCEHQFERFQRMSDDPVKECEVCGQPVERLLFPVAIHFKGKGFYSTDYARRNAMSAAGANSCNGGSSESSSDSDKAGSKDVAESKASVSSESVPAAAAAKSD